MFSWRVKIDFNTESLQTNFLGNLNGEEDGDSSDPEASDIEDDVGHGSSSEDNDEGNDSGEADSLDEDDIEDVSGDEEEEEEDAEDASSDEDSFGGDEEEETEDKSEKKSERKTKTVSEVKADRDSGIDDPPQARVRLKKVKSKLNKQVSVKAGGESSTATGHSSTSTAHSSTATSLSITPTPSVPDEYEEDSSDEEDLRNTIGWLDRGFVMVIKKRDIYYY